MLLRFQFVGFLLIVASIGAAHYFSLMAVVWEQLRLLEPHEAAAAAAAAACGPRFLRYEASPLEADWVANVARYQDDVCGHFARQRAQGEAWVSAVAAAGAREFSPEIFSFHVFGGDPCAAAAAEGKEERFPIEPLAGLTRHPFMCLRGVDYILDKGYLLIPPRLPGQLSTTTAAGLVKAKAYYFDLGASYYDAGDGGASQAWLIGAYEARGVRFDGVYCWEAQKLDAAKVWGAIPAHIRPVYHWFNAPANPELGHADNPLRLLRAVARPEDYVVLKIDIDNTPVEEAFVQQILSASTEEEEDGEPLLTALIDAFYFEHHVNVGPMNPSWKTHNAPQRLADTYDIFTRLRMKGVAAHPWV